MVVVYAYSKSIKTEKLISTKTPTKIEVAIRVVLIT